MRTDPPARFAFVRRLPRQPPRYLPTGDDDERLQYRKQYPQAPWRFVVGLEVLPAELWPPPEALAGETNPVHLEFFVGRIEEPGTEQVLARLWARPSGRESWAPLSVAEHLRGQRWRPGSVVHVWTWISFGPAGERHDRVFVKVQTGEGEEGNR